MRRAVLGFVTGLLAVALIAATVPTGVDAFLADIDARVGDLEVRVSALEDTTTTTDILPSSSTSTVPSTTTTTLLATTTTVAATTTTVQDTVELTSDWIITEDDIRTGFTVDANGFQILIDGADVEWSDFTIRNAARVMWHNECGVAALSDGLVVDSGVSTGLGFYPLHWHLCGDATRGTVVDNVSVVNGRHHAFVPHGSNGISLLDTTAVDVLGDAYWWDSGQGVNDPHDLLIDGALADGVSCPRDVFGAGRFHRCAAFTLRGGTGLTIRNSEARNVTGGSDCSGFQWPEKAGTPAVWTFENNVSYNVDCHGIFVWQNDSENHVIDGFAGNRIDHGAYKNEYVYNNVTVDVVEVHALGWEVNDSEIGTVETRGHNKIASGESFRITDSVVDRFVVDNAGGDAPGLYLLVNVGLACSDVEFRSVFPGTEVVVDGQEC